MSIEQITSAIAKLPPAELAKLGAWFEEYLAQAWDKQIEEDVQAGRLDTLIQQAEHQFESGQCRPL